MPVALQDPLADGPVIQSAGTRALNAGTTLDKVLAMASSVVPSLKAPVIIFTYYNTIMRRGMETFCNDIRNAGFTGACPLPLSLPPPALQRRPACCHLVARTQWAATTKRTCSPVPWP